MASTPSVLCRSSLTTRLFTDQNSSNSAFRPAAAQSRPGTRASTSRPWTAASSKHEASYVVAIFESRGIAHEVGLAAMDRDTGRVVLVQLADCPTYVKTLHQMHIHYPALVLVPETFVSAVDASLATSGKRPPTTSLLVRFIIEEFQSVPIESVPRRYWNDGAGMDFVTQLCVEDDERAATLISAADKYYALSAASALFKHAEYRLNARFAARSLRIRYLSGEGMLMIDLETARNLELVSNIVHKKSAHSLFGVLNHTYTAMAARLLRANLLAPMIGEDAINARLDVVEELIQREDKFAEVRDALKRLNRLDFDKLISSASPPFRESHGSKSAFSRVSQMLGLQSIVRSLPFLQKALAGSKSQLLQIVHDMVSDKRLVFIADLIADNLNEEAGPVKSGLGAVNARVYAVRANRHRLLDVARETFKENVGDIMQLNTVMAEKHGFPLALVYQENGFVFTLKKDELEGELPSDFINVTSQKGRWYFSSMELKKMNARMKDALDEALLLSNKIIQDLVEQILAYSGALYAASEAVAIIDLLWSFAHTSIMRPEFTGTFAVKAGRHPILETVQAAGTLVPNDIYCCDSSHFQIVQGPNMSGKSTYLRQSGLLVIMAMAGCFVPAEYASFRIHDALLSRLSNDDDIEKSLSTFANEMATSAMILGLATPKTLVLVDELGRGTSTIEGVGIAHAIAEELIRIKCFVFFATHFHQLSTTLSRQPSMGLCRIYMSTQRTQRTSGFGMVLRYRIVDGLPDNHGHYGVDLATLADLPRDVMQEAKRVTALLTDLHTQQEASSQTAVRATHRRAVVTLQTQLSQALKYSALPEPELISYLARFQKNLVAVFHETCSV
ncbi:muts domain V-domain-containing protein [Pisolithus croceorrhizus]|nr:muts domain V-domain-containing protein [Pisolithus croceorrhizus]KAI6116578.1 muts domain V-domain-containing protein [Pisolithus croceorrhizus]KAI6159438.1 muts domain V-domain-containing protein [Pisolithus thermaeus]